MGVLRAVLRLLTCSFLLISAVAVVPRIGAAQFLCSAGGRDGQTCEGDDDCRGGVCVIPQGVCEASAAELELCICPSAECVATPVCSDEISLGTCNGGVFEQLCCDLAFNCSGGSNCIPTQRLCLGGDLKGFPCLIDENCPGSFCRSTGGYCAEGDNDSYSCVDQGDCPEGECIFAGPPPCAGDCNRDNVVTVDELLTGVSMILSQAQVDICRNFDVDRNGSITIDELISGVQSVLRGCPAQSLRLGRAKNQ